MILYSGIFEIIPMSTNFGKCRMIAFTNRSFCFEILFLWMAFVMKDFVVRKRYIINTEFTNFIKCITIEEFKLILKSCLLLKRA